MPCKAPSLQIWPSPQYMYMTVCSHTRAHTPTPHMYLKLRENAESPHASSCLLSSPLVREGAQTWQQPVLGSGRGSPPPGPKPPAQCGLVGTEGPTSWSPLLGLQVQAEGGNLIWILP